MKRITYLIAFMLAFITVSYGQTVLINPAAGGGFESGATFAANGWTASNGTNNPWIVGTGAAAGVMTGNQAYIASTGTTYGYNNATPATNYFWRDVTIPAGETIIKLSFNWKSDGEDVWDLWQVFYGPTTITPVGVNAHPGNGTTNVPAGIAGATNIGFGQDQASIQTANYSLPASLAGTTIRIFFVWKSDGSDGVNPPAAIDNISMTSRMPGNFISIATGNYGAASTWDGNIVPEVVDNITISTGHTVTINAASQAAKNVIVNGTLDYGTTPTAFDIAGDLTVNSGGTVNVYNGTTGKTLNVAGNVINNGSMNVSVGTTGAGLLVFNGSTVQSLTGTGTFVNNMIRNLTFSNTSTIYPNINWGFNNVSVEYNLNISNAKIALGTNKLTFGTSASAAGNTFTFTNGGFIGGKFARWWTAAATGYTTSGPTSTPTGAGGRYPFYTPDGTQQRIFYLGRTTPSAGGVYAVTYNNSNAFTTGLSIADGAYTITNRWNGNFVVTTEGTTPDAASNWVTIFTPDLYYPTAANSRVVGQAAALSGTNVATTASVASAQRSGVSTADVTTATGVTLGISSTDLLFTASATGNWNAGTTWNTGTVPTCTDNIIIPAGINVTVNSAGNVAKNITIMTGGTLTVASGDLTGGCTLNNNVFTNNGTLTVTGGTLNVNGNMLHNGGSTFNQSGGDINVDGNNAGAAATSVASGTSIVQLNSQFINWTGGTLTIVDPHANTTSTDSFNYNNSTANASAGPGHTLRFGNGVSTDAGGSATYGFRMNTFPGSNRFAMGGNLVVNGGSGTNRFVATNWGIGFVNGTITAGSTYRDNGNTTYFAGNLVNNGTYVNTATVYLGSFTNGTAGVSTNAQTVSGTGTFANLATAPTANLTNLTINNSNVAGVTLSMPLSVSGTLNLTSGTVNTTTANMLSLGTATAAGTLTGGSATAYINGPFTRTIASGNANTNYIAFPVGKAAYAPIALAPTTTAVTVMKAETFDTNTGTADQSITGLSALRRWEAPIVSGTVTNVNVRLGDANIVALSIPVMASTAAGAYASSFGSLATFTAGTPNTTQSITAVPLASYSGFISFGLSNVCSGTPVPGNTIASANNICFGTAVTLSAQSPTPPGTGITYQWQSSTNGTTFTDIPTATAVTYTTTPSESLYYRLAVTCSAGPVTGTSTPIQVTFANTVATSTPGTRCGLGTVNLAATGSAGTTVKWFAAASGGAPLATGTSFVTPSINTTTTFYAEAQTAVPGTVTIGTGTALTGDTEQPTAFCNRWPNYKSQTIYTVADLTAAGLSAGNITSMAYNVATLGSAATNPNFTVRIATTSLSGFTNATYVTTGFNTVYGPLTHTHTASGWQTITFSAPFVWDGTSNIIVEVTHEGADSSNNTQTYYTTTGNNMMLYSYGTVATATSNRRLNVMFGGQVACGSARMPVVATVTTPPALTLSGNPAAICAGQTTTPVTVTAGLTDYNTFVITPNTGVTGTAATGYTFNPTATTTYTLTASQSAGTLCATTTTVTVTVNPVPTAINIAPVAGSACADTVLPLVATGGQFVINSVGNATTTTTATEELTAFCNRRITYRYQSIYTAAELIAAGVQPGNIVSLTYNIISIGDGATNTNYIMKVGTTTNAVFPDNSYLSETGFVTVYGPATYTHAVGLNTITFTTPFPWDGTSNIVVSVSHSGINDIDNAETYYTDLGSNVTLYNFNDLAIATGTTSTKRFNARFNATIQNPITWSPVTNLYTNAAGTTPYVAGTNAATVYFKSGTAGTQTYTASSSSGAGCTVTKDVVVTTTVSPAPTAAAAQTFCGGTVANLVATGTAIKWYAAATGGTALAGTTALVNGNIYYATQTINGCESLTRTAVTTTVTTTAAPTGTAAQTFCNTATVANLAATGTGIQWYAAATGGTALVSTTALVSGTIYYASQTVAGCESTARFAVTATVNVTAVPTGAAAQTFCNLGTVASLVATGTGIQWYAAATGGAALASTTPLVNGNIYYASQTISGCESAARLAVTVTIAPTPAPTGTATQTFCNTATVADLTATGSGILWYTAPTGGTALATTTPLVNGTAYYASQTITACESIARLAVTANITVTPAPTGTATQTFCNEGTVADLSATGTGIQWYADATGGTALAATTALINGTVYYASQTVAACESATRFAVTANIGIVIPPTGEATQIFCNTAIVDELSATGSGVQWYAAATGGTALTDDTPLVNGTVYYASQTVSGCESATRFEVTAQINTPAAPTGNDAQAFCNEATVADLSASGTGIQWYADATGGTALTANTPLVSGTVYHASQTIDGCESIGRFAVTAGISVVNAPTGDSPQTISANPVTDATIEDIVVAGDGGTIIWYPTEEDALAGTNALEAGDQITTGTTYYATQTIGACTSATALAVEVTVVLDAKQFDVASFTYYPNPVKDVLTLNYSSNIESVTVYNMLGQPVISQSVNALTGKINMGALADGTYMINVTMGDVTKTIRVIKKQ